MEHSYEEIRGAALDILAGREAVSFTPDQYEHLKIGVAEVLRRREVGRDEAAREIREHGRPPRLSPREVDSFLELFWDLFRQGIITLGKDDSNPAFPFFRVSRTGRDIIQNQGIYFFHDVSSYSELLRKEVPDLNPVTLLYLQEAMQAFRAGCMLSATVMLGVAAEHSFLQLLERLEDSLTLRQLFKGVFPERTILGKFNKFRRVLEQNQKDLPAQIKEDLDTHFAGIQAVLRTFRNQSGHPTGQIVEREQVYILLQLFIPYCKKMYQLMDHFK